MNKLYEDYQGLVLGTPWDWSKEQLVNSRRISKNLIGYERQAILDQFLNPAIYSNGVIDIQDRIQRINNYTTMRNIEGQNLAMRQELDTIDNIGMIYNLFD